MLTPERLLQIAPSTRIISCPVRGAYDLEGFISSVSLEKLMKEFIVYQHSLGGLHVEGR